MAKLRASADRERLQALIEKATVDCYSQDDEHAGLLTMITDNVVCPFEARLAGEKVVVTGFEWPHAGPGLYALCERKGRQRHADVRVLEWLDPRPEGFEWIEAYLAWRDGLEGPEEGTDAGQLPPAAELGAD